MTRFALWNNKGGVGKSLLSFIISAEYAAKHPDKRVLVVDMCPQANLSEIFLGGNGDGGKKLDEYIERKQTIGDYFNLRINQPHGKVGEESTFYVKISEINDKIPNNMWLVVGSPQLEIQAQVINQISYQTLPPEAWKNVHLWLADLLSTHEARQGEATTFIDCNPSFSAYTEIAILAASQLIIPCSSDGSSARAIDNLAALVYGQNVPPLMKGVGFNAQVKKFSMSLPIIRAVLLNRSTQYRHKASKAFGAMFEEIKRRVDKIKTFDAQLFHTGFFCEEIPDTHTPSIVCSHYGIPIKELHHNDRYEIHGKNTQVSNEASLKRYKESVKSVVDKL